MWVIVVWHQKTRAPSWSLSYGSCIYNYLCNQCLSTLTLWARIKPRRGVFDTILCDIVCQWLSTGLWFSSGTLVSSTNKTDRHDITEILLSGVKCHNPSTQNTNRVDYKLFFYEILIKRWTFLYSVASLKQQKPKTDMSSHSDAFLWFWAKHIFLSFNITVRS